MTRNEDTRLSCRWCGTASTDRYCSATCRTTHAAACARIVLDTPQGILLLSKETKETTMTKRLPTTSDAQLAAAAPALLEKLKFLRDNFGVALPLSYTDKVLSEVDALIATVSPGWPVTR